MPKLRNDFLRWDILTRLRSGAMTTPELAAALHQSAKVIATTCARMERDSELRHVGPRKRYAWHRPENAPPVVDRQRLPRPKPPPPLPVKAIPGVTADDIEWMNHYRQQAAQRSERITS